jgi:hypothetical protein
VRTTHESPSLTRKADRPELSPARHGRAGRDRRARVDWADSFGLNEFEAKALEMSEERSALTAQAGAVRGVGNDRAVSTATASSFLNAAGTMGG